MDSRVRATSEQFSTLLEYMESHSDLARPLTGPQGRIRSDQLWADLTNILNAIDGGVIKITDKWKKVWADLKSKTKKKALTLRRHGRSTESGPASQQALTTFEKRVLAVTAPLAVEELGINRFQSSAPSQSSPPFDEDPLYLEIKEEELPQRALTSPTSNLLEPSTSQFRRSWSPLVVATTSLQEQPAIPVSRAHTTLLSESPWPRSTTQPEPQSSASPTRQRVRARRRFLPTSFRRKASESTQVELRRLQLEITRGKQQHEREMRALEIEHERNQLFKSLVDIAQAALDHYRSRDTQNR